MSAPHESAGSSSVARAGRLRALLGALRARLAPPPSPAQLFEDGILDLFEELVYVGEITADGHYVGHASSGTGARFLGGGAPDASEVGALWESRVHPDDFAAYERFNRRLLSGDEAEVTYRLLGLDGATRTLLDRARPLRRSDGSMLVHGIISDITVRQEAAARLAEANGRFISLLDVVGEHVYLALALPDGSFTELFQGPGADRLLGGAHPDSEMRNWDAAVHPDDSAAYAAFNRDAAAGEDGEVEYRLIGADGVTRWVHDRAVARPGHDGAVEISGIVSDVTERRRLRAELAEAHAALSRVVESMDDHLYTVRVDAAGGRTPIYRGPNMDTIAGGPVPEGRAGELLYESLVHEDDRPRRREAVAKLRSGAPRELEYRVIGLDGRERVVLDQLRPRLEPDGTLYYDGVLRDVTERRRLEDELRRSMAELDRARGAAERRARTDELTGAFNRRHFAEIAAQSLAGGAAGWGLLILDADHFKHVNDDHGHVVGDAVLVELARRLRSCLGPRDCLARWGGEEFALLLDGVASDAELDRRAQRLRGEVRRSPIAAGGVSVRLTISIGAALAGAELDNLDALVEAADRCLYVAKRDGRDRVSLVPHLVVSDAHASEPAAVSIARALALTAGAREGVPEGHAEHVALLAMLTAERMALPVGVVLRCRLAGWLHDVGKAAIPERMLDKTGPLDEAEWAVMRTHPAAGEEIVTTVPALREAAGAVRHHHERYDGAGYPDRLKGVAIPIEARIVAAADAYAAMTVERPYSPARTPQQAADELRRSAGSQLDPGVVAALLDVLDIVSGPTLRVA